MDSRSSPLQAAIATPEEALPTKPFGLDMKVLLATEFTGGAVSIIMSRHEPGEGPPDHVHFSQEEILFIIEGVYEITIGGQTATAGPGTLVFIPRNVVHRFRNVGDTTGCLLDWTLPSSQDRYLVAISELAGSGGLGAPNRTEASKAFDADILAAR